MALWAKQGYELPDIILGIPMVVRYTATLIVTLILPLVALE
jgi:hypothetical protein